MSSDSYGSGIGLAGALFLVFLVLKLVGTLSWSWWWITAPLWMPWAFALVVALLVGITYGTVFAVKSVMKGKR